MMIVNALELSYVKVVISDDSDEFINAPSNIPLLVFSLVDQSSLVQTYAEGGFMLV